MPSQCLLLIAQLLLSLSAILAAPENQNDLVNAYAHDTDVNYRNPRPTSSDDDFEVEYLDNPPIHLTEGEGTDGIVTRHWGVPDSVATVGKLFFMPITKDTFTGNVDQYRLENLPNSITYDGSKKALIGVPLEKDIGHYYVDLLAMVSGFDEPRAKERFLIEVVSLPETHIIEESKCRSGVATVLTLVSAQEDSPKSLGLRAKLVKAVSKAFTLDTHSVTLNTVPKNSDPLSDDSALYAGPGDTPLSYVSRSLEGSGNLLQSSFAIGCDGHIDKQRSGIISTIQSLVKDRQLSKTLGTPIIGYHVVEVDLSPKRVRRNVEDDYYDYSGDDEYDYGHYDELFKQPDERIIPTFASPVFPDSPPTDYNPEAPVRPQYVSPVLKQVPISTPVYIPVKPTVIVEPSPTLTDKDYTHPGGFGDFDLESSMLPHPTTMVSHTTPLSSSSSHAAVPTRDRQPLEPTAVLVGLTTEYDMKNFPPTIEERIPKLAWVAGHTYRMKIPENAFHDLEDGNARNLSINLRNEKGQIFGTDSWIQFEPTKQEIYALPLENNIGKYDFNLEAIDKGHKSVRDLLKISVYQSKEARNFNHQFTATLKFEKKHEYEFKFALDWQVRAVEKIASFFGNGDTNNINIRNITLNPVHITWTNVSLINSSLRDCPEEELTMIMEKMVHNFGTDPTREMKEAFMPEFKLKKIHSRFDHPCEKLNERRHEMRGRPGTHLEEDHRKSAEIQEHTNGKPIFRNQIDQLNATEGQLFRYSVPSDTCYDMEDGDTTGLRMHLLTTDLVPPPPSSWLQFDETNQEFYGLPLHSDVGKRDYILACVDRGNEKVSESLIVRVFESQHTSQPSVKFSITINMDYQTLMSDAGMKVELVERIARTFGDQDSKNVYIESLVEGSVVVTWRNSTLSNDECPYDEINHLRSIMTDKKGILKEEFKNSFGRFNVTQGIIIPYGECLAGSSPTYVEEHDHGPPEEKPMNSKQDDYLLTYIVPAVIIAVMLLIAALIACCLYKKRRYGKMSMADDRTFVSKGIPIIFAEELDDHRTDNAKSPVIMKEEKPPLPPPEYQKSSPSVGYVAAAPSSTPPRMDRRARHASGEPLNSGDDTPYHPPPPFTASNGASRNQRPNLPPAYRKPPTYVPP